jgi:hypothetical protein
MTPGSAQLPGKMHDSAQAIVTRFGTQPAKPEMPKHEHKRARRKKR